MKEKFSTTQEINKEQSATRWLRNIADIAPDIADIFLATLSNPISGLSTTIKKIAEKASAEANIQKEAEAEFQAKVKGIKDEFPSIITNSNIGKTTSYLTKEINKLAEDAIKLNNETLMDQVITFYKSAQKRLLASSANKPLTTDQLADIKTELGIMRLKVLWADSQKSATLAQKIREEQFIQEQANQLSIKERALQIRVFLFFIFYIGGITAAILFGSSIWPPNLIIPWLGIPISIVFWSAIGSLTNILYKYYKKNEIINIDRELRWIWARPLVGVIMGCVTYLVVASGLILIGAASPQNANNIEIKPEILSLFAFIGSFSDKIFEGVVEKVGLIALSEKNNEEELKNLIEILSSQKVTETDEKPEKKP